MGNSLKADFKAIKLLPTLLSVMLGFGVLNMVLGLILSHDAGIYLGSELLRFLSVMAVYVLGYRLTGFFKEFAYTNVFFAIFVFSSLALKIVTWLKQFPLDILILGIAAYVFYAVSELAIMLGVNYILLGIARKYEEMNEGKPHTDSEKTRRIWITSQILVLVIGGIILPIYTRIYDYMPIATIIMIIMITALCLGAVVYVCIHVYRFCFEYYMYMYNGPKGARRVR